MGYTKVNLPNGLFLAGANFKKVNTPSESIKFSELVSGNFQNGDQVQFFNPEHGNYTTLYYVVGNLIDIDNMLFGQTGWGTITNFKDDFDIKPGTGFWIKSNSALTDQYQAGEVVASDSSFVSVPAGYTMVANKYPMDYYVSELLFDGIANGDQVQFFDPELGGYTTLYYVVGNLIDIENMLFGQTGWGTITNFKADQLIAPGTGFWLNAKNPIEIEFPAPEL